MNENISVVLCVKNEENRIHECLKLICENEPDEIIIIDGGSNDNTIKIAEKFKNVKIVVTNDSNLTQDRQMGINLSKNDYVFMIDADHRLYKGAILDLFNDMQIYNLDICQSSLLSFRIDGFWEKAEQQAWELTHNKPGQRRMIGTAPSIYKKKIFENIQFDDNITKSIDDTDFFYRLSKLGNIKIGIGNTIIKQLHFSDMLSYYKKFYWYGKGDYEFCKKHPERAYSMYFHLLIRYSIYFPIISIMNFKFFAAPFFIFQGVTRFYSLLTYKYNLNKLKKWIK